jgi:hypothetical protein
MADKNRDILPPEPTGIAPYRYTTWEKFKPAVVVSSCSIVGGGLAAWMFSQFLQARGFTSLVGSRVFLFFTCLGISVVVFGWTRLLRRRANTWFTAALILITVAAVLLDSLIPMPQISQLASVFPHSRPSDWRTIKDWQKAELGPTLEQFPNNTLRIVVTSSAPDETWDYANQFKDFFRAHKWNVIGPETAATNQIVLNVQLSISEQYWAKQRPDAFTAVESAMRFVGINLRSSFVIDPLVSPKELVMWIGPETPPGYPEHIPLQLGMACQHPLQFTDDTVHFLSGPDDFVRWVRIKPPAGSRFVAGQKVLVVLSKPAKSVATSEQFNVQALGRAMPRPDALDVTVTKQLKTSEPLEMKIISDEELRVKCVVDRSLN